MVHNCRAPESRTEAETSLSPRNLDARLTPPSPILTLTTTMRMQAVARYAPRGNGSKSTKLPGSTLSLATRRVLIASSANSSISTQLQGSSTVIPASAGDSLFTANTAVPICITASRTNSKVPPSPPAAEASEGTSMTSRVSTTTEPIQSTLSVTLS